MVGERIKRLKNGDLRDELTVKMAKGLEAIARVHEVPETNMEDLLYCVEQIQNTAEQPFAWDTELYHTGTVTQHDPVPPPVSIASSARLRGKYRADPRQTRSSNLTPRSGHSQGFLFLFCFFVVFSFPFFHL